MKQFLLLMVLMLAVCVPWTHAQDLSIYNYETGVDATKWVDISTGSTSLEMTGTDIAKASAVTDIGFSFTFAGTAYTQFSVNSAGNLRFGSTVTGTDTQSSPFSSTTNANKNAPKINFFGANGKMVAATGGGVKTKLIGESPNRVLIVEFATKYSSSPVDDNVIWQVQLFETTNTVQIVYSPTAPNSSSLPYSFQLGMSSSATDVVRVVTATNKIETGAYSSSNNIFPSPGRYYRFTTPTCYPPTGITSSNVTTTSADVSWMASGMGEYQWQYVLTLPGETPDWSTATLVSTTSCSLTGLIPSKNYTIHIRSYCSAADKSAAATAFVHTLFAPLTPAQFGTVSFEEEEGFVSGTSAGATCFLNGQNNWVAGNASTTTYPGYIPFVFQSTSAPSGKNCLKLHAYRSTKGDNYDYAYAVLPQLDFTAKALNQHQVVFYARKNNIGSNYADTLWVGVMTDPANWATFTKVCPVAVPSTVYAEYTAPLSSYQGAGTYIAIMAETNQTVTTGNRLGSFYVDDLQVEEIPACKHPTNLAAADLTTSQAVLSWTPGSDETLWNLRYRVRNTENWTTVTGVTSPYTLTGLADGTPYEFQVQADCSSEQSRWSKETASFDTKCNIVYPVSLGTISFEDSEGFEVGEGKLANCWTAGNLNSTSASLIPYVMSNSSYAHTGSSSLRVYASYTSDSAYAAMPYMTYHGSMNKFKVAFQMRKIAASTNTLNYNDTLYVGVVQDPTDLSTLQIVGRAVNTTLVYSGYEIPLSSCASSTGYIVFLSTINKYSTITSKHGGFFVDDVKVYADTFVVTANVNDAAMGSVAGAGACYVDSTATLTAIPAAGHSFVSWSNGATTPTISFVVTKDTSFTATFEANPSYLFEESDTICQGDTLIWRQKSLTAGGVYYDSLKTVASGIDSVYKMTLTVNPTYLFGESYTICQGATYTWRGRDLTVAGVYYDSLIATTGCDSVYELTLTVNPKYLIEEADTICQGQTYTWHSKNLTTAGVYYDSLVSVNGCDSVYELTLTVNPKYLFEESYTICQGVTYTWRGRDLTAAGVYCDSLIATTGCDSVYQLTLTVNPTYLFEESYTICQGETYTWRGRDLTVAGVYYDSLIATTGCDSVYELTLTVNPKYLIEEADTICQGQTYTWHSKNLTVAGVYYDSLLTAAGCDSVYELTLTVNPKYLFEESYTICQGETYTWRGRDLTAAGVYYDSLIATTGCDSVYQLTLTVNPTYLFEESYTICQGETYTWRGRDLTVAGVYYDSLIATTGCDSVYKLTLTVNPTYLIEEDVTICQGETYVWHSKNLTVAGVYYDSLITVNGCDSVYELTLTVNPTYLIEEDVTICQGETYVWHSKNLTVAGVYYDSLTTVNGCDSVYELTLTVNPTYFFSDTMTICIEPITWREQIITTPGTYYDSLITISGCDSVYQLVVNWERFTVTAAANDETMGYVTGGGTYQCGDTVTLTATPAEHYHFTGWSNGETDTVITFIATSDSVITANFAIDRFVVNVNITGAGSVSEAGIYDYGDVVTLIATPGDGYQLSEWVVGDTTFTGDTLVFVITCDTVIDAHFTLIPTSVDETEAYNYVAYVEYNDIVVSGVAEHNVAVYDMNGRLVQAVDNASDIERFTVHAAGVYVIRVDNRPVTRVIVK